MGFREVMLTSPPELAHCATTATATATMSRWLPLCQPLIILCISLVCSCSHHILSQVPKLSANSKVAREEEKVAKEENNVAEEIIEPAAVEKETREAVEHGFVSHFR